MFLTSVADEKFVPLYAAMLHSSWLFNPGARHGLIDAGITKETRYLLQDFASSLSIDIQVVARPDLFKTIDDLPNQGSFIRLFVPDVFPQERKIIYLDSDISVTGDLTELFQIELNGHPIAAMPDSVARTIETETQAHGIDFSRGYFNSGVMLIDCAEWTRRGLTGNALAYWREKRARMKFNDQAALNGVLQGDFKRLDNKWNFYNPEHYIPGQDIRVLHHTHYERPWVSPRSPFIELHRYHRSKTPWPMPNINHSLHARIRDGKRLVLGAMGVQKYKPFLEQFRLLRSIQNGLGKTSLEAARNARNSILSAHSRSDGDTKVIA